MFKLVNDNIFVALIIQDYRGTCILNISNQIDDEQYKGRNTLGVKGFTRNRLLNFKLLVLLISRCMVSSIQREMNAFFSKVQGGDYSIHAVSKGALTQARAKLRPEAFLDLNETAVKEFYGGAPYHIWKIHRVLAIDSSVINLPSHPTVKDVFGEQGVGCNAAVMRSMARVSLCYDVLNLLTLDARIDCFSTSEQVLMREHLTRVKFNEGDLLLADRGYPSIALMYTLQQKGIHFCMRMKDNWWKEVDKFNKEGVQSKEVVFKLPKKDKQLQDIYQSSANTVRCRLVSIELENGEQEILCTSLLDEQLYSIEDMKELYHLRWNIEEAYKLYKCRAQLEVFSGKTANSVKQDFFAKVFMMTMCALLSFPIDQKVRQEVTDEKRKHQRQINRTNALAFCKEAWVVMWLKKQSVKLLKTLDHMLLKTTDIIRKGRKFKRNKIPKKPPAMTYKQLNP